MKDKGRYLSLYREITGNVYARPINTISSPDFSTRIVRDYSFIPDYLIESS